jgi:hypothetical protein
MALYGQVLYGQVLYGVALPTPAGIGPTTFVPTYCPPTASVVPRGGGEHLDRDLSAGMLQRNALGRPALARGPQRLVSRIIRAMLTEQGSWWGDIGYGSTVLPGGMLPDDAALALSDVALHEAQTYQQGPLAPDERIAGIRVDTITTAAGTSQQTTLVL